MLNWIIGGIIVGLAVLVIVRAVMRMAKGEKSCCSGCSGCSASQRSCSGK